MIMILVTVRKYDDDVHYIHFALGHIIDLDYFSASSLGQQSSGRHLAPLRHNILITSELVFAPTHYLWVLSRNAAITNFMVLGLTRSGLKQRSNAIEVSTLTITPLIRLVVSYKINVFNFIKRLSNLIT